MNPETELMQKIGNNGNHRKQEAIEYYARRGQILKRVNNVLRQIVEAMKRFRESIPKDVKRKGKFREN